MYSSFNIINIATFIISILLLSTQVNATELDLTLEEEPSPMGLPNSNNWSGEHDSAPSIVSETPDTTKSSDIQRKSLSQTSERCIQLSKDIKLNEGKPMRRSAAIGLHDAECTD